MTRTPTLETERLILRPLSVDDAPMIFSRWANDPEVTRYMSWNTHRSVDDTLLWLQTEEASLNSPENYSFGIVEKESNELIGSCGILYDEGLDRYGIGYILAKPFWNMGYATEASRCFLDFAINVLGLKRFFAFHAKDNPASGSVIRKLGFIFSKEGMFVSDDGSKVWLRDEYLLDI